MKKGEKDLILSIFTGERPTGVGSIRDGELEIGIGRKNRYNDDKGVHDGVPENDPLTLSLTIGLFTIKQT